MNREIPKLLEIWRETHAPEVSALLERMSTESLRVAEAVKPKQWFELAQSPGDHIPALLQIAFDDPTTQVCRRMQVFSTFAEAPRIGAAVGEQLRELDDLGGEVSIDKMIAALFDALVKHGDHAHFDLKHPYELPKLEKQLARLQTVFASRVRRPLTAGERAMLSKVDVASISGVDGSLGRAHNDDQRAVAIDALLEAGGPRAEFILLQTHKRSNSLTPKERAREKALKKKYARGWMGPVAKVMDHESAEFVGGRLAGGYLWAKSEAVERVLEAPEWSTVRLVEFARDVCHALLRRWPNITEVEVNHESRLRLLEAEKTTITHLTLTYSHKLTLAAFPRLEHLTIEGPITPVFGEPVIRKLRTLTQRFEHDGFLDLPPLVKLLKKAPPKLEKLFLKSRYYGWRVELTQDLHARLEFIEPDTNLAWRSSRPSTSSRPLSKAR